MQSSFATSALRLCVLSLLSLLGLSLRAQVSASGNDATAAPRTPLEVFLADPAVNPDLTSVYIAEIASGKVLAGHNVSKPLMPASTMKIVTTAALMRRRDMNYRFSTRVETAGRIVDGILEGNLHITGGGDPTLNSDRAPESADFVRETVKALQKRGIRAILGKVLVDQSIFTSPSTPASWSAGDKANEYGAGAFGFNFRRNHSGSRSVADPSAVFLAELERAMAKAGISLEKRNFTGGGRRTILTHTSAPLDEIMRSCMMRSDNLYAECLLRHVAVAGGLPGSVENGASQIASLWRRNKAPMQGVTIVDGSGLSRSNRLTAAFLAHVLRAGSTDPYFASFFPLAGAEGTLRSFLRGTRLETYVALKTGSLHDVQAYAGFLLDDDYAPTHVIVVTANSFRGSRSALRAAVQRLLLAYLP